MGPDQGEDYYDRYTGTRQSPGPFTKFLKEQGIVTQHTLLGTSS